MYSIGKINGGFIEVSGRKSGVEKEFLRERVKFKVIVNNLN